MFKLFKRSNDTAKNCDMARNASELRAKTQASHNKEDASLQKSIDNYINAYTTFAMRIANERAEKGYNSAEITVPEHVGIYKLIDHLRKYKGLKIDEYSIKRDNRSDSVSFTVSW